MADDIVNPVGGETTQNNEPIKVSYPKNPFKVGDKVAVYGGDESLTKYWAGEQGEIIGAVDETMFQVQLFFSLASSGILKFHRKQLRPLKDKSRKSVWLSKHQLDSQQVTEPKPFDVQASLEPQDELYWLKFRQGQMNMTRLLKILFLSLFVSSNAYAATRLINGTKVDPNDEKFHPVVNIRSTGGSRCTATVVGPKVLITAAHCGDEGEGGEFTYNQTVYRYQYQRSPLYPGQDHDLSLAKLDKEWTHPMASVSLSKPAIGSEVTLVGYGCTQPGGGSSDGFLRYGTSNVTRYTKFDFVTFKSGGSALCFGDSGGPVFDGAKVTAVNSKGNIKDTSYLTHFGSNESKQFINDFIVQHDVKICGVNKDCEETEEEFTMENQEVKIRVTDKEGGHNLQYVKRHFEMLMMYLVSGDPKLYCQLCDQTQPLPVTHKWYCPRWPGYVTCPLAEKLECDKQFSWNSYCQR